MLAASDIPDAVRALLPAAFTLSCPAQGETSEVAFVHGSERTELVVKRTSGPIYSQWLAREADVLRALEATDLPVPKLIAHEVEPNDTGDAHWLVMTRVPGESVWPELLAADASTRHGILSQLGRTLGRVHATPIPKIFEQDATPWLDRHRLCAAEFAFEPDVLDALGNPTGGIRTLIHGDFTLDNVLYADGEIQGVIDWSGSGAGDPRFDITLALATAPELALRPADLTAFFDGYTSVDLPAPLRKMVLTLYRA
ncbi:MAG: phosphotransferase [Myxococcota bacterium]